MRFGWRKPRDAAGPLAAAAASGEGQPGAGLWAAGMAWRPRCEGTLAVPRRERPTPSPRAPPGGAASNAGDRPGPRPGAARDLPASAPGLRRPGRAAGRGRAAAWWPSASALRLTQIRAATDAVEGAMPNRGQAMSHGGASHVHAARSANLGHTKVARPWRLGALLTRRGTRCRQTGRQGTAAAVRLPPFLGDQQPSPLAAALRRRWSCLQISHCTRGAGLLLSSISASAFQVTGSRVRALLQRAAAPH